MNISIDYFRLEKGVKISNLQKKKVYPPPEIALNGGGEGDTSEKMVEICWISPFLNPGEVPLQQETLIRSLKLLAPCILWDECREVGKNIRSSRCVNSTACSRSIYHIVPFQEKTGFSGTLKFKI